MKVTSTPKLAASDHTSSKGPVKAFDLRAKNRADSMPEASTKRRGAKLATAVWLGNSTIADCSVSGYVLEPSITTHRCVHEDSDID